MLDHKALVINYSAPEMNHLAAAMADADVLLRYVRPYANQNRGWERAIANASLLGNFYDRTFGRRSLPFVLHQKHVREVAIGADMLSAAARYFMGRFGKELSGRLHWYIQKRISAIGAGYAAQAELIVSSYHVAKTAFEQTDGDCVLNYPIAHHRYIQKFVAEEAEREPDFAVTLPDWSAASEWEAQHLDAEIELADFILVGSSFARESFITQGVPARKLIVIPYGANVSRFSPPPDKLEVQSAKRRTSEDFHLLYVGHLSQRKGVSYLLRAFRLIRGAGTRLTLVGNYYGDLGALAPYRDLFQHVPHAPQSVLVDYYRQADVFVFPTLIEGLGLVVLEAMASGLPVITTPNGPGDIVRDGIDGFVVPIRDVDAIVEKLEYLRSHPEERLRMGQNARKRALQFSWASYRQGVTQTLLSLLNNENTSTVYQSKYVDNDVTYKSQQEE